MALEVYYQSSGGGTAYTNIGTAVRWGELALTEAAELGEAAISSVKVDDPNGTGQYLGLRRLYVLETAAGTASQMMWRGYVTDQSVTRGDVEPWGSARVWTLSLVDDNAGLGYRVFTGTAANRSAESGSARLAWALTEGSGYIANDGLVSFPGTSIQMDATDYRGQYLTSVLADVANASGYEYFAQYNGSTGNVQLFFADATTSTAYASTLKISNVGTAIDGMAVLAPDYGATLTRDPSRIAGGVYLPYAGGTYYGTASATITEYGWRDQIAPTSSVRTAAGASAVATRLLGTMNEQEERVSCRVWVPKAQVNDIRAGHRIEAQFTHFPGWTDYRWCRVVRRTVSNFDTSTGLYELTLELVPQSATYTGDAYLGFLTVTSSGSPSYQPVYDNLGDDPQAGWFERPTVSSIFTPRTDAISGKYNGFSVARDIVVRIKAKARGVWVADGDQYLNLVLSRNGEPLQTASESGTGGLRFLQFSPSMDIRNQLLRAGDIIEITGNGSVTNPGWANGFGSVNDYVFEVGRGTFTWNSGNTTWTGP